MHNSILSINLNGSPVESVFEVRSTVFNHFKSVNSYRPKAENLNFKTIIDQETGMLESHFKEEEVKQVVWDCDNYKIPRPDNVSFGFLKEFCDVVNRLHTIFA